MQGNNPFNKWKMGYKPLNAQPSNPGGGNLTPANHKVTGADQTHKGSLRLSLGETLNLPRNLYQPPSTQSLDLSHAGIIAAGATNVNFLSYTVKSFNTASILFYAINTDGPGFTIFTPSVNGFRVYPTHGNPQLNHQISIATGPDLGNNSFLSAQLPLKPGDVFRWYVSNTDIVPHNIAIRTTGFLMSNQALEDTRFGG